MSKKRRRSGKPAGGRNTPAKSSAPGRGGTGQGRDGRPQASDGQPRDGKAPGREDTASGRRDAAKNERKKLSGSARRAAARKAAKRRKHMLGVGIPVGIIVLAVVLVLLLGGGVQGGGKVAPPGSIKVTGSPLPSPTPPPEGKPTVAVGKLVPSFSAPGLNGGTVSWAPGRPTVLVIWAAWCPHCQVELPILNRVKNDYPGIEVVSINTAQGKGAGPLPQDLVAKGHITFPVAIDDAKRTLATAMGVEGFPTVYFVNPDGTVYQQGAGEATESDLRAAFADLQEQAGTAPTPAPGTPSPG